MQRPTIPDLAKLAGVSVATVNRVLSGAQNVRHPTRQRVQEAAEAINFYGTGAIQAHVAANRPKYRLGFLLHQPTRSFYRDLGAALALEAKSIADAEIDARIEYLEDLSPQNISARLLDLAETCDAIAVVAAVHPMISETLDALRARNVPIFALISQLSATGQVHYIGLDNWKVGRTAAWAIEKISKAPGKLGILVGNHRYRCQEMNESGFRSYYREYAPEFTLLEPLLTFESSTIAQEMTEKLLREHPDLTGLYVAGGGITGALTALRNSDRAGKIAVVGYQLMEVTRAALLDGSMTLAISHPLKLMAQETVAGMRRACEAGAKTGNWTSIIPFELYTRENI
ncbi:MAG: LacI family DNA-binding transcriptional regulator [Pseudomonadota bacterium]